MPMYLHSHALFLVPPIFPPGSYIGRSRRRVQGCEWRCWASTGFMGWDTGMYKKFYNIE